MRVTYSIIRESTGSLRERLAERADSRSQSSRSARKHRAERRAADWAEDGSNTKLGVGLICGSLSQGMDI